MSVSKRLRYEIFRRDNHTCRYCGRSAPDVKITVDHVLPEALGGTNDPGNLVTACADCNSGKSATPPDAPLVDNVAEDAIRWARAIAAAGSRMLAEHDRRQEAYDQFDEWWSAYTYGPQSDRRGVPKPDGWHGSIDAFLAAGLPLSLLEYCVAMAMSNQKVRAADTFRYMCGIAWKKVTELQEHARRDLGGALALGLGDDAPSCCNGTGDLAITILETLADVERKVAIGKAEATPVDERLYEDTAAEAAYLAVGEMDHSRGILAGSVDLLVGVIPMHLHEEAHAEVLARMGDTYTDYDVAANTVRHLTRAIESGQVAF